MKAVPLFSVVIPTRHRPELLARCLECLAAGRQAMPPDDYEVIVTDDGSDSATKTLITERFTAVRWTQGLRRGPAANRNHGAALARGEWLAFIDDDCVPDTGWLAGFADAISREDAVVLEGRTTSDLTAMGPFMTAPINETGGKLWSCNFALRAETFRRLGGFDEDFPAAHLEDVDFHRRVEREGLAVHFVSAAMVTHPPRRIGPVLRQVRDFRAYFYFARKHRLSLAAAGLSVRAFVRGRLGELRRSRTPLEALRFGSRVALEAALLLPHCAWWAVLGAAPREKW